MEAANAIRSSNRARFLHGKDRNAVAGALAILLQDNSKF